MQVTRRELLSLVEDDGRQKHVEWTPNPNPQLEIRTFTLKLRRA